MKRSVIVEYQGLTAEKFAKSMFVGKAEGTIFGFFSAFVDDLIFVNDPVKALIGAAV